MPATPALTDPCGRFLPALIVHDLHDRLYGRSRRANARWGRLERPDAQRRLLWIVSGAELAVETEAVLRLSTWERVPAAPGTLLLADEPSWLKALAPHLAAIHLATDHADSLWQALAGGSIVTAPTAAELASPEIAAAVLRADDENDVIATWVRLGADAGLRERALRAARLAYNAENRLAVANASELLERVCRWQ
jgi:hypothetical protein